MATSWQMAYQSGTTWSSYWNISNPNNDLVITKNTNRIKTTLYDGSIGRRIPSVKYFLEDTELEFQFIDEDNILIAGGSGVKSLSEIVENGYKIRLKTHDGGVWEGYIQSYPKLYKLSQFMKEDGSGIGTYYDVSITMDLISVT